VTTRGRPSRQVIYERLDTQIAELWQRMGALLAEGRAVGDKLLTEHMEVRGYADAAKWVYGQRLA
jgi:hypothetical protein